MKRHVRAIAAIAALVLAAVVVPFGTAQATPEGGDAFRPATGVRLTGDLVRVHPRSYRALSVDVAAVRRQLAAAPPVGASGTTEFALPTPDGATERFAVQRSQVMESGLAADHPELQTWSGSSLDNPGTTVALDVTPMGFHASVRGPNGQHPWYIDPAFNRRATTTHLAYDGRSLPAAADRRMEKEMPAIQRAVDAKLAAAAPVVTQRTYRLALVSDPTYADYFGSANVLAEKVTLMVRVNQLYNDDVSIDMVLVDATESLNFDTPEKAFDADGPCGHAPCWAFDDVTFDYVEGQLAYCDVGTLQRNQTVLGQLVGASNYDLGHVALGTNGGGIAGLGVVGSVEKAMGCTGLLEPVGDFYAVDYVAHEMGHQFGGNHTFNGVKWACSGGNRNGPTSVEPGSGSSIMAYAGICKADNLQPHSDPYFSQRSLTEINRYVAGDALDPIEVQDVSLSGFETDGDTITLDYNDSGSPVTLTRGSTYSASYTAAHIEAAIEGLTGTDVTIGNWGYDPYAEIYSTGDYPAQPRPVDDDGFQVMFAGDLDPYTADSDRLDMDLLTVTGSDGVTAHVGESAKGGHPDNQGETTATANHAPVVKAPSGKTIPMRTPFTLTGKATDADGDDLVYLWEQNDAGKGGGTALLSNTKRNGPLFRIFGTYADVSDTDAAQSPSPGQNHADGDPSRTFPDLGQVLAGNTNATNGRCRRPATGTADVPRRIINCFAEFLPTKDYANAMRFRLTARDSVPGGGGIGHDDVTIKVAHNAGPFLVSSVAKGGSVKGGTRAVVTWKVNGTKRLARNVAILLSTDNGRQWSKVLAKKTRNDGRALVRFPRKKTGKAWIMIQARGNYFFDVNDRAFRIR